jgi:hypothetical protein
MAIALATVTVGLLAWPYLRSHYSRSPVDFSRDIRPWLPPQRMAGPERFTPQVFNRFSQTAASVATERPNTKTIKAG